MPLAQMPPSLSGASRPSLLTKGSLARNTDEDARTLAASQFGPGDAEDEQFSARCALAAFEQMESPVLLVDGDGRLLLANRALHALTQCAPGSLVGLPADVLLQLPLADSETSLTQALDEAGQRELPVLVGTQKRFPALMLARVQLVLFAGSAHYLVQLRSPSAGARGEGKQHRRATDHGEAEKRRLSRALYDDLGQSLSALKLDVDWLEQALAASPVMSPNRVSAMRDLLDHLILRTRSIASSLRPPLLDDFGLLDAVKWNASELQKRSGLRCSVRCNADSLQLGDAIDTPAYRMVQECLLNAERHAEATEIEIVLWHTRHQLDIVVRDNGKGMPPDPMAQPGCSGLAAMQDRITNMGGSIHFGNKDPQGAVIHATIPVDVTTESSYQAMQP